MNVNSKQTPKKRYNRAMKSWFKNLFRYHNPHSLINISISRSAILHNLNEFRRLRKDCEVAPVLKSNAYGHGLTLVADILKKEKLPFLVIDSFFEARALRNEGIKHPLLIIGYTQTKTILDNSLSDIKFVITSLDALEDLSNKIHHLTTIHLKIDTGMHRQGLSMDELEKAFEIIKKNHKINFEGICSHFADADSVNSEFTERQISIWNIVVGKTKENFPNLRYWHISATAGHAYANAKANVTRLGIGLYGIRYGATVESLVDLRPALEMTTVVSVIKKLHKGDCVGYGCSYTAPGEMIMSIIPAGYYEGVSRELSNKGALKIQDHFCPIIGKVSMNITAIDVSNVPNLKRDDKVVVISNQIGDRNSIENMARDCGTIAYEIASYIPAHLKRTIID